MFSLRISFISKGMKVEREATKTINQCKHRLYLMHCPYDAVMYMNSSILKQWMTCSTNATTSCLFFVF